MAPFDLHSHCADLVNYLMTKWFDCSAGVFIAWKWRWSMSILIVVYVAPCPKIVVLASIIGEVALSACPNDFKKMD